MKRILVFGLISLLVVSGCAWFETKEEKTAQELASDGMDQFNRGKYKKAIESFEKLKDWYPFSKFVILSELKIADAYYNIKEYEEAVAAYEEFENLHPRNEAVPYTIYQIGLCYFEQIDTVDRDQTSAKKALDTFNRLKKQFPVDSYTIKAQEHIKKCLKSLAGHEFYVGIFYLKNKHYKAALNRFKSVLSNYPDVGVHQTALQYIALCEALLKEQQEKEASQ
ncbi:MAG: outer membrane protein assembly factor BamD [Desulfobacteraceae bacterium]|nr:MAG: outer membrane protein assembly factor BamD [Desulfobacteraceae bacterium]